MSTDEESEDHPEHGRSLSPEVNREEAREDDDATTEPANSTTGATPVPVGDEKGAHISTVEDDAVTAKRPREFFCVGEYPGTPEPFSQ